MNSEIDREDLAVALYEADQRIRYGYVKTPWNERPHGAAKQHTRKVAELILFDHAVTARRPS